MQLYLRPFYNILRQKNNFEWTTEHQKRFEEIKTLFTQQLSGPTNIDSKSTFNHVFNLHGPLDTIPLSKLEI